MERSPLWSDEMPSGKFFERTDVPTLHGAEPVLNIGPLVNSEARIPPDVARPLVEELM
jgi:2-oxoglutarate ferredoxin oxidoreductase subunit beta